MSQAKPHHNHLLGRLVRRLGPGLITGAADDDPSGIATYAQAGAAFGYALGWSVVLTLPFMVAVQEISARIGRVTGAGLGAALRHHTPRPLLFLLVGLLVFANLINLGADIGAMADAARLVFGGPPEAWAIATALFCAATEIWISYKRYATLLKWMTLALIAYVVLLLVIHLPLGAVLFGIFVPRVALTPAALTTLLACLGTTISPYLFFWQAAEEVEEEAISPDPRPLRDHAADAPAEIGRIGFDTWAGMAYSNFVSLCIIVGTAATLHAHGVQTINTAGDAAAALIPIAGRFASLVFALGIFGTGLLAVPVLAGSSAYALGEASGWRVGLGRRALEARAFYAAIACATLLGTLIIFSPLNPMRALFWSAVINGVVAVPMIIAMVLLGSRRDVMGTLTLPAWLRLFGWGAAILMGFASAGLFLP
ncbi:MAG TPA: divalent metal cation transporter [Acetobacteraceae bacterium]|nr:divalent metal cation transporter [Acetobacteraceae bacterium]